MQLRFARRWGLSDDIVLLTGGFDPIHSGHISYINSAAKIGRVVVGVNSDEWLVRKKGRHFMDHTERCMVTNNLKNVLRVIGFDDSDNTAKDAIVQVRKLFPHNKIIFANGGDKKNSSSWILREWKEPKTYRNWGYYRVLHGADGVKVKELTIQPHSELSMQKHKNRNEFWMVTEGECFVDGMLESGYTLPSKQLQKHDWHFVPANEWHKLTNLSDHPCHIVEIQYGSSCDEEDISRI